MPGGDVVSSGARYPGVSGRSSYHPPPRPPARPSVFQNLAHAIANVGSSVQHATHAASTPHAAAPSAGGAVAGRGGGGSFVQRYGLGTALGETVRQGGYGIGFQFKMLSDPAFRQQVLQRMADPNPFNERQPSASAQASILSMYRSEFSKLQQEGSLPRDAKFPKVVFDAKNTPGAGAYTIPSKGEVHIPPSTAALFSGSGGQRGRDYARTALIHELAHTMQSPQALGLGRANVEGGAQAWTQQVAPRALRSTKAPYYQWPGSGDYTGYVVANELREPQSFIRSGQFNRSVTPPSVNAPFTGVGSRALARTLAYAAIRASGR